MFHIAGKAQKGGTPIVTKVYVYARDTGNKIGEVTSAIDGSYEVLLATDDMCFVVAVDPEKFSDPVIFDYVVPGPV